MVLSVQEVLRVVLAIMYWRSFTCASGTGCSSACTRVTGGSSACTGDTGDLTMQCEQAVQEVREGLVLPEQ